MRKYTYALDPNVTSTLVDAMLIELAELLMTPDITLDEQHNRLGDVARAIESPTGFKKPKSSLTTLYILELAKEVYTNMTMIAESLVEDIDGDALEKDIALREYRQQLKAALIYGLILLKAKDSAETWQKARKAAIGIAKVGGALAIGAATWLIVQHMLRNQDPTEAHETGLQKQEEARKREEEEKAKRESKS